MKEYNSLNKYILTFGYGNRNSYEEFLKYLVDFNVTHVIDVRQVPRAWSRQWYAKELHSFCNSNNIEYLSRVLILPEKAGGCFHAGSMIEK